MSRSTFIEQLSACLLGKDQGGDYAIAFLDLIEACRVALGLTRKELNARFPTGDSVAIAAAADAAEEEGPKP